MRMKRTNLVLSGELLDEALRLSGERTYSATVDRALREFILRAKAGRILELTGTGLWEGNLAEMRQDWTVRDRASAKKKPRRGSR